MTPAGNPASSATSASIIPAETGASSDGSTTTVFPAATGDTTARQDRTLAPFHGVKLATTPVDAARRSSGTRAHWFPESRLWADTPSLRPAGGSLQPGLAGTSRMKWQIRFHAPALQRSRFGGA